MGGEGKPRFTCGNMWVWNGRASGLVTWDRDIFVSEDGGEKGKTNDDSLGMGILSSMMRLRFERDTM